MLKPSKQVMRQAFELAYMPVELTMNERVALALALIDGYDNNHLALAARHLEEWQADFIKQTQQTIREARA